MPAGKTRRKDDTWTTDELNRALKSSRDDSDRKKRDRDDRDRRHRDDDDRRRRHRDDVNGDADDRRRRHKDEEKRSHRDPSEDKRRHRKEQSPDQQIELTEDERERQRRQRRERKEKKEPSKPEKSGKKREEIIDDDHDDRRRHRDRDDDRRRHRDDDREKRHKDDERRQRRDEDEKKKTRDEDRRRHRDDNDRRHRDEDDRRRRHKDDDGSRRKKEDDNRRQQKDEGDRDRRRDRHGDDDERDRQRQERRDKRERKDKEKRGDRNEEKRDRGKEEKRNRDRTEEKQEKPPSRRKEPEPEEDEENGDDYNYDDEAFEDYDDDFEDDDGDDDEDKPREPQNEMDALMRAMNEENNRLTNGSQRSLRSDETDDSEERYRAPPPKVNRGRTFIDFVSAKQVALSSKTASRTKKRGEDLLQMIELDKARYDMFDLPPVREYEMYIRSFGRSNTKQAYVQTNEDNIDRDLQTDEIETKEKWTQNPSDDVVCVGGDGIDPEEAKDSGIVSRHGDPVKLAKFVEKAGQMLGMLLEEEREGTDRNNQDRTKSNVAFSDGFTEVGRPKFLGDRHVTHACFCPNQPNMLLTVYSNPNQPSENPVDSHGLICVWNINDLTYPYRTLCCESQPSSCCFSPVRASLAFCGMVDGSVVVWDLRESGGMHHGVSVGDQEVVLRFPTYNTARVLEDDNHHSPVTAILPVYSTGISSKSEDSSDSSTGLSFQLATVEQIGIVNLWVVTEIPTPDLAGSEMDLGLAPGGRVKLLKSSCIKLHSPNKSLRNRGDVQAFEMQLLPSDLNHFYVGTDTGCVVHGVRFGSRGYPHSYTPSIESPVNVVTLDLSPFGSPYLLAGCDDGSLYLYHTKSESPLLSWPVFCKGCGVRCVRWSQSRPTVFYVLDDTSTIHVMDLLESDSTPIQRDQIPGGRVVTMCLANDIKLSGGGPARAPQLLLSLDNGRTEVHSISRKLTQVQTLEEDFMEKYVDKF